MYNDQLRFLSKLIDERQTADSLSVDNMEEFQVITAEQSRDDMNNFCQETPSRKPRTRQCGKRKHNSDKFKLRIMKALEEGNQPNRYLSFFKGIIPSFQNFKI
jgi:c-di-AMP phosphodiesterase-like protein